MQAMANKYARYFNAKHQRTGTIWEGRYKSCLVDSELYLFTLYKYIEMNPIKAHMVESLNDYPWSSYAHHALGKEGKLINEHHLYQALGENSVARCDAFHKEVEKIALRPTKLGDRKSEVYRNQAG